jgi:CDP-paratose 2-epimerase
MHVLITGGCGFVGSCLAKFFLSQNDDRQITSRISHPGKLRFPEPYQVTLVDNLMRPGSQTNQAPLESLGAHVLIGDLRDRAWVETLPQCDWVIDCAANPSVLAGLENSNHSQSASQLLVDHNLGGTVQLLEYCKRHSAGMVLVSSSRVYSIDQLNRIPYRLTDSRLAIDWDQLESSCKIEGLSRKGITEGFSIEPPLSLYGTTKLASEWLAKEYSRAFGFRLWINRCGILAGAGQFGKADQGIIAYWMHRYLYRHGLCFIGLQGTGAQVRDCMHPDDLARLIQMQIHSHPSDKPTTVNVSGGLDSAFSLLELHRWCEQRWGQKLSEPRPNVERVEQPRPYDAPWIVLDSGLAQKTWDWTPIHDRLSIWNEIARHAEENPHWLQISGALD